MEKLQWSGCCGGGDGKGKVEKWDGEANDEVKRLRGRRGHVGWRCRRSCFSCVE